MPRSISLLSLEAAGAATSPEHGEHSMGVLVPSSLQQLFIKPNCVPGAPLGAETQTEKSWFSLRSSQSGTGNRHAQQQPLGLSAMFC